MTNYVKKLKGRSARRFAMSCFWILLVAAIFLGVLFLMVVPRDSTLYESYQDFSDKGSNAFHLRLDSYDVVDLIWEERTFSEHAVVFMYQEDGSTFNVILSEGKLNKLAEDGFLTTTVYRVGSSDASGYEDSIVSYFRSQNLSEEDMALYRQLAASPYYTTPFNQFSNLAILAFGLFMLVAGIIYLIRAIAAGRGGGAYRKDLIFIATSTGRSPEQVETDANESFNDPAKAPHTAKNLVCNQDYILCLGNTGLRLMRPEDVVWMYRHTMTQRVYGFRAGSTHSVVLYAQDSHEPVNTVCKKEEEADRTFFELQKLCPKAFVGYDKDMLKQAKKNNYHALVTAWNAQQTAPLTGEYAPSQQHGEEEPADQDHF